MLDLSCPDVIWWTGLLWCFYQLFGLSFWRHPFTTTAETLMHFSKSDDETLILDGLRVVSILEGKEIWLSQDAVTHIHLLVEPALHLLPLLFQLQIEHSLSTMLLFLQQTQISKLLAPVCVNEHTCVRDPSWPVRVTCVTGNPKITWHRFYQTCILKRLSVFLSIQWKSKWFSCFFCVLQTGLERQDGE